MTLKDQLHTNRAFFEGHHENLEDTHTISAAKMYSADFTFRRYETHVDVQWGPVAKGFQTTVPDWGHRK